MLNIGKKLIHTGTNYSNDPYILRTARFVNLFSIITIVGILLGSINVFFIGKNYPFIAESIFLLFSILAMLFNKFHLHEIAIYFFLLTINSAILYVNEFYDYTAAPYLFYFPLILCVALLHNPTTGIKKTIYYFALSAVFIGISIFVEIDFLGHANIDKQANAILFLYDVTFSVVISILLVILVIRLIDGQNVELLGALKKANSNQEKLGASLNEKEVLLQEIHHRVKNNLSVISSLLNLQINNATQEETRQFLSDARNRVLSMSLVHQKLYKGTNFNLIQFDKYLIELCHDLLDASQLKGKILLNEKLMTCDLDISTAVPLGLIINEIITNCIKHAFDSTISIPKINLTLENTIHQLIITISDNGKGFNHNEKLRENPSLGLTLIETLIEQIDGKIEFSAAKGCEYKISIPLK